MEKVYLSKDKSALIDNEFLTLEGIPAETSQYRLGNCSALECVNDQCQVSTDKRSGITGEPSRLDDPEYIVRRLGQVMTVSLEMVKVDARSRHQQSHDSAHERTVGLQFVERRPCRPATLC